MASDSAFTQETLIAARPGQNIEAGPFHIRFLGVEPVPGPNWTAVEARLEARRGDGDPFLLTPQSRLVDSPPTDRNGNRLPGYAGWSRKVTVEWADPVTFQPTTTSNTQLKRITVTVLHAGKTVATLVSYRSFAWTDPIPTPDDATGNHPPIAVATGSNLTKKTSTTATFSAATSSDKPFRAFV